MTESNPAANAGTPASAGGPAVELERRFAAPVDTVWKMFADAESFATWYGPPGATIPESRFDFSVGGRRFVKMQMETPGGTHTMCFVGEFITIDEPSRLVYTESLADADGNALTAEQAGMPAGSPTVTEVTVALSADGDHTLLQLRHAGIPADSPGAMGWSMALEKLSAALT